MTSSEILNFAEKPIVDESIQEYEYYEYEPQARTNLNSTREISINIELQDARPIYTSLRKLSSFRKTPNESRRYCVRKRRCRYSD